MFMILGIPVYDADLQAKMLMSADSGLVSDIKQTFGVEAYHDDGSVNRDYLSGIIFSDPDKLAKMNQLVHPRVAQDFYRWVEVQKNVPYTLKEAALLFETGSFKTLDKIIVVTAPVQLRIQRVLLRDYHRNRKQVEEIIRNQMPEKQKIKQADFVVINDERHFLIDQVLKIHNFLSA